jgi:hypothetical protein
MKMFGVLVLISSLVLGCSSKVAVNNSTAIGTDANGFGVGQYSDSRSGEIQSPISTWLGGGGGGGGLAGAGAGAIGGGYESWPVQAQGDPMKFARAIATINYSRRLQMMSVDDAGGSRDYTFTDRPLKKRTYQPFGHQTE